MDKLLGTEQVKGKVLQPDTMKMSVEPLVGWIEAVLTAGKGQDFPNGWKKTWTEAWLLKLKKSV